MSVKVADKFVAMGDFELLDAQDVLVDIEGTPKPANDRIVHTGGVWFSQNGKLSSQGA